MRRRSPGIWCNSGPIQIAIVGTVDDTRRQLEAVREKLNPDWFMILSDQGFLPRDEMKEQLEILGTKIIPEFAQ